MDEDLFGPAVSTSSIEERTQSLNYADTFGVFTRRGDIAQSLEGAQGIFHRGLRFLSRLEMSLGGLRPVLLSSSILDENQCLTVDMTNPTIIGSKSDLPHGHLHIRRSIHMHDGVCTGKVVIENYGQNLASINLAFYFDADFKDIFEVRGVKRSRRGELRDATLDKSKCSYVYLGLDKISRMTCLEFLPTPSHFEKGFCSYALNIDAKQSHVIEYKLQFSEWITEKEEMLLPQAKVYLEPVKKRALVSFPRLYSNNEHFNSWWARSRADMEALLANKEEGFFPYAGVPWYNTPFGRDGLITALEVLDFEPDIAKGVIRFLANRQAMAEDPNQDAEPGKIIHEIRQGEMAETGELPFKTYYGSVDATPLFLVLIGEYYLRTGNIEFIYSVLPNIQDALSWIDSYGDLDGDGFVEYNRRTSQGLLNQGWKDSHDSISHSDGTLAKGPIALAEVQGYVYHAKVLVSRIAMDLGMAEWSNKLKEEAIKLKEKFNKEFWDEEQGYFALALDGAKRPCRVKTSNIGHCLYSGIIDEEKIKPVVETLMSEELHSGWGIRTLAKDEVRYNPMSYHNGSIWPHDTAIVALGLIKNGYHREFNTLFEAIFDASRIFDENRLPELFCGFDKGIDHVPVGYPVACIPQAWAVGTCFFLLKGAMNISIDAPKKIIRFDNPSLPSFINSLRIKGIKLNDEDLDLELIQHSIDVGVNIGCKPAGWKVLISK